MVAVLTYSRVGIVLTVLAALAWLVFDERRYESIGVLAVAWIVGAVVAGIALLLPGISDDLQPHDVRVQDGLLFGAVLLVGAVVVVLRAAFVLTRAVDLRGWSGAAARRARAVAAAVVRSCARAVPATSSATAGTSSRIRSARRSGTPAMIRTSSSNRWRWWQEAWNTFTATSGGTGAGTFGLTDRLERDSSSR